MPSERGERQHLGTRGGGSAWETVGSGGVGALRGLESGSMRGASRGHCNEHLQGHDKGHHEGSGEISAFGYLLFSSSLKRNVGVCVGRGEVPGKGE